MSLKTEITLKCKSKKSRDVMMSQLILIQQGVKDNQLLKQTNGDESLAIRSQLHWDLHELNSGANRTYALEHIAGLVGLILMTRAWEGYLVGAGVQDCDSFVAFMKTNKLDLKHVEFCLDRCARELLADFWQAQVLSPAEHSRIANAAKHSGTPPGTPGPSGGDKGKKLRTLANKAAVDPVINAIYQRYINGEITQNAALIEAGIREPHYRTTARALINHSKVPPVYQEADMVPEDFVRFALNFVADNFKDGIPTDLKSKYAA